MSLIDIQIQAEKNYIDCNSFEDMNILLAKDDHIETRCGEIFISRCKVLIFLCCECKQSFTNYEEFFNHLCEQHVSLDDEIKYDPKAENFLNVEYYDEDQIIVEDKDEIEEENVKPMVDISPAKSKIAKDVLAEDEVLQNYGMTQNEDELSEDIIEQYYEDLDTYDESTVVESVQEDKPDTFLNDFSKFLEKDYRYIGENRKQDNKSTEYLEIIEPKEEDPFDTDSMTNETGFECKHCGRKFESRLKLKTHNKTHTKERKFKCHICSFAFTEHFNLRTHLKRHEGARPHSCDQCEKKFITKTELNAHIRTHTGERPYICEICGTGYVTSGSLNEHKKRHNNNRPHKCTMCDKTFYDTGLLKEHLVVHTGERKHVCDICKSSFTRRKALLQHKKLHSIEKQYKCIYCNKAFAQKPGLASHLKTHRKACNIKEEIIETI